ncbi:hypothetical protein OVY01_08300 [Robbsia sp. Bb-Pol-6]|uniref:Uncharacterized protein n=1 Tax=Robbsia betulipollinis TaxID=2981849 RepID=A0ABT3ZL20_9BURK|nr:hypothetical protein [Robbsia betulipollinis]MCY0387233.1 hypothetical protein [Robbsia betulipollinis]
MDDAVLTRIYGYHGRRAEDVYNATRFPERRYAVYGVDGYNRMLSGALERVDNSVPRPYASAYDGWIDERDAASEARRANRDAPTRSGPSSTDQGRRYSHRVPRAVDNATRVAASTVETGREKKTAAATGKLPVAMATDVALPAGQTSRTGQALPAGQTSRTGQASRASGSSRVGDVRLVLNMPADSTVTIWHPASTAVVVSNGAAEATRRDGSWRRHEPSLAEAIKAEIREDITRRLRRNRPGGRCSGRFHE